MTIETERLILRPFLESDAADVYEYLKEPAVNCFASMKLHSMEEARAEMKKRAIETEYYFAIVLKDTGKVIGEIDAKFPMMASSIIFAIRSVVSGIMRHGMGPKESMIPTNFR